MRIIAGTLRGMRLAEVGKGDASARLRPTSDRVREALFNVLLGGRFGDPVSGARILDLFAGTGALGFEALSRGAAHVTFVEKGRKAQALIAQNMELTRSRDQVSLLCLDALRLPKNQEKPFTLVFLDPPYGKTLGGAALKAVQEGGWIAEDAIVVWEENAPQQAPPGYLLLDTRRYGDTHVTLLQWTGDATA